MTTELGHGPYLFYQRLAVMQLNAESVVVVTGLPTLIVRPARKEAIVLVGLALVAGITFFFVGADALWRGCEHEHGATDEDQKRKEGTFEFRGEAP
ncbi:MAG: hypothetical protein ACJ741_09485 [Pyrinomonadaceae bacterium]